MNSRPLVPLSDDPFDLNALKPAHFLIGEVLVELPEPANQENQPTNRLQRWELVQQLNQVMWNRWHDEYLTTLINRTKWKTQQRNFQINDFVIIQEDNMPPTKWHLGRIIEIIPSRDRIVRAAKIRTLTGDYTRPILKLALLLPDSEEPGRLRPITEALTTNLDKLYDNLIRKHNKINKK